MKPTQALHDLGQSLWLDNITRDILNNGTLQRYINELSVTGLTSNPTIFDQAIKKSASYDTGHQRRAGQRQSRRGAVLRPCARRPYPGGRPVPRSPRADQRASTDGYRWKSLPCWLTTPPRRSPPPKTCTLARRVPTCSSKFLELRKACRPSKRPSSPASRSTSRCCSRGNSMSLPPRLICAASSVASPPGLTPT